MLHSRGSSLNPSTPTFRNISQTETTNLIVAWKFNQNWLQKFIYAP